MDRNFKIARKKSLCAKRGWRKANARSLPSQIRPFHIALSVLQCFSILLSSAPVAVAGDLLRGGAGVGRPGSGASGGAANPANAAAADRLRGNSNDALARTTQALQAVKAMQAKARAIASGATNAGMDPNRPGVPLPDVPDGLQQGGLVPDSGLSAPGAAHPVLSWKNAETPVQTASGGRTTVTVRQTAEQALLNWNSFNIGASTKLKFDQSAGGANQSKWIAFNKVSDPSGVPSQILGSIEAPGQVYVINQNGIIFGGASQINTHVLAASSLPINTNLLSQGLLNNPDAQFLFSALPLPGGSDGTLPFVPEEAYTPSGKPGDIIVQKGAQLESPLSSDGKGGRIMLVGSNVINEGTISTPSGQAILAAGLQVGVAAHASGDPSLRGLDVWVGKVTDGTGTVTNSGLITAQTGAITMVGRELNQLGGLESTTSVNLNGRIDLLASYGAVSNPNYDNAGAVGSGGPMFFNQFTGSVNMGEGSVMRILPVADSTSAPGTTLPEASRINIDGLSIHFAKDSALFAPAAKVRMRAGVWPYVDTDGDGTVLSGNGTVSPLLLDYYTQGEQRFLFSKGQIYFDPSSFVSVAGTTDVFVPLAHNILTVELRGSELADSPLQRLGNLSSVLLTLDMRRTGEYQGRYWMGTPLGDATGFAALVERTAMQMSAAGGTLSVQAGDFIVVSKGATLDVSGGYYRNEGGMVDTTRLIQGGNIIDIANADPGQIYDGIHSGIYTLQSDKWGVIKKYPSPLGSRAHYEAEYLSGAAGGVLNITAPSMALEGELLGTTLQGERQKALPFSPGALNIALRAEKIFNLASGNVVFLPYSPYSPRVIFTEDLIASMADPFELVDDEPAKLREELRSELLLSTGLLSLGGFGSLSVENADGDIFVPTGVTLKTMPRGSIALAGANITIEGSLIAPGGKLVLSTYNISPTEVREFGLLNPAGGIYPDPRPDRGLFTLAEGGVLSAAGLFVDQREPNGAAQLLAPVGGSVTVTSLNAHFASGSLIDVSGGGVISTRANATTVSYGAGGSMALIAGRDSELPSAYGSGAFRLVGGKLILEGTLEGYSGGRGASLALQSSLIEVGPERTMVDSLLLSPDFFRQGGFSNYALTGIGAPSDALAGEGEPDPYLPAILIAPGVTINPVALSLRLAPQGPGESHVNLERLLLPEGERAPTGISFTALGFDNSFTDSVLEVRGDIVMKENASILLDAGGSAAFNGQTVTLLGNVKAPGGSIKVTGASSFPMPSIVASSATHALATVHLGSKAHLSTKGTMLLLPDAYGRRTGAVTGGGSILVSGNIVAEAGALLDVSGASGSLDVPLWMLGSSFASGGGSGLVAPLASLETRRTRVESAGGSIELNGSQMLFSDATLLGASGGSSAAGGTLSIFSGRFYTATSARTSADINLVVTQSGLVIPDGNGGVGIGRAILDPDFHPYRGMGYFAVDRFHEGGFDSLDLGAKFLESASPIPYGGNVKFVGPVTVNARGLLRVAGGGVIESEDSVHLNAAYLAVGQPFRPPQNPGDTVLPFQQTLSPTPGYTFAPTYGTGNLSLAALMMDVGTLSLQKIGAASLTALGDIRGNGTVSIAGDLTLQASQIYPPSLTAFDLFAYDHAGTAGSITILSGGTGVTPLSAGGQLGIYASNIIQGGALRAPLGSITLGWDGDADFAPFNPVVGSGLAAPVTEMLMLKEGSLTSVAAVLPSGSEMLIPFGLSPDGTSWIGPNGENITLSGLPSKEVRMAGANLVTEEGSVVDLRGGGDLAAYRWISGPGGSVNLLGSASREWSAAATYKVGDLVFYQGQTWSARAATTGVAPSVSLQWTRLPESYAILPDFASTLAPYAAFNTGSNAGKLLGDPGFVSNLPWGASIQLKQGPGLAAGAYTLLPKRYALLPGAFLVTPLESYMTDFTTPEGAYGVGGYLFNAFAPPAANGLYKRYEVAPRDVVLGRVAYQGFSANRFIPASAAENGLKEVQRLPVDAGHLIFQGSAMLDLRNSLLTAAPKGGRGAMADVSSLSDIRITNGKGSSTEGMGGVELNATVLSGWGIDSLLIGGVRTIEGDKIAVNARTSSLTLDNEGAPLTGTDVILVSRGQLTIADGASIVAAEVDGFRAANLNVAGDGALVRVSADRDAGIVRSGLSGSSTALLAVEGGASLAGAAVILDSSRGTQLDPLARLDASALTLGSGQVSILLEDSSDPAVGSIVEPHLILSGALLADVQQVGKLKIQSYSTIDFHGTGVFGNTGLDLEFNSSALRGFGHEAGVLQIVSRETTFSNKSGIVAPTQAIGSSGRLELAAEVIRLGDNAFHVTGFGHLTFSASKAVVGEGKGSFTALGDLTIRTALVTGASGSVQAVTATGAMQLDAPGGETSFTPGIGATLSLTAASINANTRIALPSGKLELRAISGDLRLGGSLSVAGTEKVFFDLVKYTDAGEITLQSDMGNIIAEEGSIIDVAAASKGGSAGTLKALAANGQFVGNGTLLAQGGAGGRAGSFGLDTESLASYGTLNDLLATGGFTESRRIRVRTGDVTIDGVTRAHEFALSTDLGNITVNGTIDASGETGGSISLAAHGDLVVASGAELNVHGKHFSSSGKGGEITLEAGATYDGLANLAAVLDLSATGALFSLGVDDHVAGSYVMPGSSAFNGQFTGVLHLRAPRTSGNDDLKVSEIGATITGASGILVEGYEAYDLTSSGGTITGWRSSFGALPTVNTLQRTVYDRAAAFLSSANFNAMSARLLGTDSQALASLLVIAPGVEILNRAGDLTLGSSNTNATALGSASQISGDWNLADFRFGPQQAAGILTLRAAGNLNFYNALSDGFAGTLPSGTTPGQSLWLSPLKTAVNTLPLNLQSWSYRLAAGADLGAADFRQVRRLDELAEGKGSLNLGKYYSATLVSGAAATTAAAVADRYQVIRTGAGNINIAAGRDVQLRNQFATIYTAGVALPDPASIFGLNDFVIPSVAQTSSQHPDQGSFLGGVQQIFRPQWSLAGGDVTISAQRDIGHYTVYNGVEITDTSRQLPTNWLYRRGYVDPATGLFGVAGVDGGLGRSVTDASASTTWWIDFSNFFQGIGALGGGDVALAAGRDIINVDAVVPTNARMPGRVTLDGVTSNAAPDALKLVELGGGDLLVTAGRNIDGGLYYVERGEGRLFAQGSITTNARRSPSLGILGSTTLPETIVTSRNPAIYDALTWMPTMLFVGKSSFDVGAFGSVLAGPAVNPFLLPQGLNNKFWYKTYFNTFAPDAGVRIASYAGDVTHRLAVTLPGENTPRSVLDAWILNQNFFAGSSQRASNFQPWIRLAEADSAFFKTLFELAAPSLYSTVFEGDINLVGKMTLFPSPTGTLELVASGSLNGLNPSGRSLVSSKAATIWTAAKINLSDADPKLVPGVATPLAYHLFSGRTLLSARDSRIDPFASVNPLFLETGSYSGRAGTPAFQQWRHAAGLLHRDDAEPVRIYAAGGDIGSLSLFTPKATRILAQENISDIEFYIQNISPSDISTVAAGRDLIAYNENSSLRTVAGNLALGNVIGDLERTTVTGGKTKMFSGDIQISGPGTLEVFAGRNLDLGSGPNLADGTGVGITSIGNFRNPFLPFGGADVVIGAGIGLSNGLSGGAVDVAAFIDQFILSPGLPGYLEKLGYTEAEFLALSEEEKALLAMEVFYQVLRDSGRDAAAPYVDGRKAIATLFPEAHAWQGSVNTRARDIRSSTGGSISIFAPGGGVAMASDIYGNPLTPPGIVTEYGGGISLFTDRDVDIGRARIFTLRGGDIVIWSSHGNIAAGTSPKTVVTAPPTRVVIDITSADVATDLGGLATGGGIGVLAAVKGVTAGDVDLIAPVGKVDAGDAGIRSTGNVTIAASVVLNAGNIQASGASSGVPTAPPPAAPNLAGLSAASSATSAAGNVVSSGGPQQPSASVGLEEEDEISSFTVEVIGYGG